MASKKKVKAVTVKAKSAKPAKVKVGKKGRAPGAKESIDTSPREFTWTLGELPSSQHRAGLAGLVMMVRWLKTQPGLKGTCDIVRVDETSLTVSLNQKGLRELFDETYGAEVVERESGSPYPNTKPLRVEKRKVPGAEGAKSTKEKTVYIYEVVEPRGAFLADLDGKKRGKKGLWVKLWRDFMWSLVRGVPATRAPFNARANGEESSDAADAWEALTQHPDKAIELPSTYFLGAQASNAEGVSFRDRARYQFLLHFWPFAVGLAVPMTVDRDGKSRFQGVCVSFPDLLSLEGYADDAMEMLRSRSDELLAYLPREAVLDVPAESGLQFMHSLGRRLEEKAGESRVADLLLAVDVIHIEKEGNNTRVRSTVRIEPKPGQQSEYARIKKQFKDPIYRRQRLINLLAGREWHVGFDRLVATMPASHFLRGMAAEGEFPSQFPFDANTQFTQEAQ